MIWGESTPSIDVCFNCGHTKFIHKDERGCHSQNCECPQTFMQVTKNFTGYRDRKIPREIKNSDFLKSLWDEMRKWHGDPLKQ